MFNKENRSPNVTSSRLGCLDEHFQVFREELTHLLKWVRAGENELFLRQQFDLNPKNGYSIPIFDFVVYFKEATLSQDSIMPYKYLRRLYLSEYVVKVKAQTRKYQNFHKKHDVVLKVWHQLVRIIGSTPNYIRSEANRSTHFSDHVLQRLNELQQSRMTLIRKYMQRCQDRPQSKTEQLNYLQSILAYFLQIEDAEEKLTRVEIECSPKSTSDSGLDERLRQLDFCRLWRTRYNNDSRIVVNTTEDQLEQRQLFCQSSNSVTSHFDWFSKNPCNAQNILSLSEHVGAFVMINNSRNAYNCSIGSVHVPPMINGRYFSFSIQEFVTDLLPYLRCCMHTLSRISSLQSQKKLSLFESYWDVSFICQALHLIRHVTTNNASLQSPSSGLGVLKSKANGFKKRLMGKSNSRGFFTRDMDISAGIVSAAGE